MSNFKLSSLSIALFSFSSIAYSAECEFPITINAQMNANIDGCTVNTDGTLDKFNNISALVDISASQVSMKNVDLALDGDKGVNVIQLSDSTLSITDSKLSRTSTSDPDFSAEAILIRAGQTGTSKLVLNSVELRSQGDVALIAFDSGENTQYNIEMNNVETVTNASVFESWWGTSPNTKEDLNLNIAVKDSILSAPAIIVASGLAELYREDGVEGKEKIDFTASNSRLYGAIITEEADTPYSTLNLNLKDSTWNMRNYVGELKLFNNGVTNLNLANSEINSDNSIGFQTLTIFENLSGSGSFILNTDLANEKSDKIVVKGQDSGEFTLGINDRKNEPNAANGKVTLVETATGQAKFSLKDREYVDAGAYRYRLNKEGTNWVLANHQAETVNQPVTPTQPEKPVQPVTPTQPETPVQPVAPVTPTQPETPAQPVNPTMPTLVSLSEMTNGLVSLRQAQGLLITQNLQGIHQRLGELKTDNANNVWVKNQNGRIKVKAQNVAENSRSSGFTQDVYNLQIGADKLVNEHLRLGAFVGTSGADLDFNGEYGKGKLRSQAIGFYGTFANKNGWYSDNVVKYERLSASSDRTEKRYYNAFTLSTELGKRIVAKNAWVITPQAQLAYTTIAGKSDEDRLSLFTARVGLRISKGFVLNSGWNIEPYAEINTIAEKANDSQVRVNQYTFDVAKNKSRVQTALGFTAGSNGHRLGLEVSQTQGSQVKQPWAVQANYRYQW